MACVNVCPMGIDIRNGQQLACITCALCIDACDDVMDKIGKPRGLIGYLALTDESARARGQAAEIGLEPRLPPAHACSTPCSGPGSASGWSSRCSCARDIDVSVTPVRNPTFVTLSDGTIRNTYDLRLRNKHGRGPHVHDHADLGRAAEHRGSKA